MILSALLLTTFGGWLLPLENRLVFFGARPESRTLTATPADFGLEYERLNLTTSDGVKLMAWALPYAETAPWLLYFHGNGGNIADYLSFTSALHNFGFNVLMLEYRGYGESEGAASEAGLFEDARTAYRYLIERSVSPEHIGLYGFSLGSGVAVDLASEVEVGALVIEAGYTSVPDVARELYRVVPRFLMHNRFDSQSKIARVDAPVLFIHSPTDRTVPFSHGETLYALAGEPKAFVRMRGGHTELLNGTPDREVLREIGGFLERYLRQ